MEVYILYGQEISLADLEAEAKKKGMGLEDFKAFNSVTVKKKGVADQGATVTSKDTEASWESRLENTRSDWEKYRKSQLLNKEGKYDPNLIADPNHLSLIHI